MATENADAVIIAIEYPYMPKKGFVVVMYMMVFEMSKPKTEIINGMMLLPHPRSSDIRTFLA